MSMVILRAPLRPQVLSSLARPGLYAASARSFSSSSRALIQPDRAAHASTALKTGVREREINNDLAKDVVGEEGKGVEGPHYQGAFASLISIAGGHSAHKPPTVDQVPAAHPLTDMSRTGAWTMMNPIYTKEVSMPVSILICCM